MAESRQKQHERVMLRFDRAWSPQQTVREKCIEATRFVRVPGGQWEGATVAGTKLDDQFEKYPKFEINKVATELNRIIVTNGAKVIQIRRLKSDPGVNLLS